MTKTIPAVSRVALLGPPGSGKSSIGKAWLNIHRVNAEDRRPLHISFAAALKWQLAKMLAYVDDEDELEVMAEQQDPANKDAYRALQQALGQFRRKADPSYWLDVSLTIIDNAMRQDRRDGEVTYIVVDDCRFPNEEAALRQRGFIFVRLEPGSTTRPLSGTLAADESEQHWPKFHADVVLPYKPGPEAQAEALEAIFRGAVNDFV